MVTINSKHKKLAKRSIYVGLLIVAIFWIIFAIIYFWNSNYNRVLSNNAAVLTEVVAKVDNLPDIGTIEPSKTSGNLPGLVTSYITAAESIKADRLTASNIFTIGIRYVNGDVKTIDKEAAETLDTTADSLLVTAEGLNITQKFIEYAPAIDLELYKNGQEQDASERLARTQVGLQDTVKAIEKSKLPYRKEIIDLIKPLENKATELTPQTVDAWASDVLEVQKKILIIIQADYEKNIGVSTQELRDLSSQYLLQR